MKSLYSCPYNVSVEDIQKMELQVSSEMMIALGKIAAQYGDFYLSFGVERDADCRNGKYFDYAEVAIDILAAKFLVNSDGNVWDKHCGMQPHLCAVDPLE